MKKKKRKNSNGNKLGTLTTFKELLWRLVKAQKVFYVANLTCFNLFDINLKYHTVVHKYFENYEDLRM